MYLQLLKHNNTAHKYLGEKCLRQYLSSLTNEAAMFSG